MADASLLFPEHEKQARRDRYFMMVAVSAILTLGIVCLGLMYILWQIIDSIIKISAGQPVG